MKRPTILGYYDPKDRAQVVADASPVGLGAVLVQYDMYNQPRIISFAHKSLTDTEKHYAQTGLCIGMVCRKISPLSF